MSNSTKILFLLTLLLVIIGVFVWWFVAMQNNGQAPETPVANPTSVDQTPQAQSQDQTPAPTTANQTPDTGNPSSPAPSTSTGLANGNTNDDISKDLTNVDSQMNSLNSDVTNSNPTVTPIGVQ